MIERVPPDHAMTPQQLAEHLQTSLRTVRKHTRIDWPHSRIGSRIIFTPPQIQQIYALIEVKPEPPTARLRRIRGDSPRGKPRAC